MGTRPNRIHRSGFASFGGARGVVVQVVRPGAASRQPSRHPSLLTSRHPLLPSSHVGIATATLALAVLQAVKRRPKAARVALQASDLQNDEQADDLPTDEELREDLHRRLPVQERIRRQITLKSEKTLEAAEKRISDLGIDLEQFQKEIEERGRILPPLSDEGPLVAVCITEDSDAALLASLRQCLPDACLRWLDMSELAGLSEDEIKARLGKTAALAVCPGADLESAATGFSSLIRGLPETVSRIVLLSDLEGESDVSEGEEEESSAFGIAGALIFGRRNRSTARTKPLENLLTVAVRDRGAGDPPLYATILRGRVGETTALAAVSARLPATVQEASRGLRSTLVGGIQGLGQQRGDGAGGSMGPASPRAVAFALAFALRRGVDVPELIVTGHDEVEGEWDELMLPLMGPELWRLPVEEPRRARAWVHGWVDFNYCRGANKSGPAMRRAGLKTPVEVRRTALGACLKFMPPGTRRPGCGFEGLVEGGLEILVDDEREGRPGRMRVRRCAYGWRRKPREGSERSILSKLQRDWQKTLSFR